MTYIAEAHHIATKCPWSIVSRDGVSTLAINGAAVNGEFADDADVRRWYLEMRDEWLASNPIEVVRERAA